MRIGGLQIGWAWTYCGSPSESSRTTACVASYHRRDSPTWRWALYVSPKMRYGKWWRFAAGYNYGGGRFFLPNGNGGGWLCLPFIGTVSLSIQPKWRGVVAEDASEAA